MFSFFEDHFRISRIYLKKLFPFLGFALHKKFFLIPLHSVLYIIERYLNRNRLTLRKATN